MLKFDFPVVLLCKCSCFFQKAFLVLARIDCLLSAFPMLLDSCLDVEIGRVLYPIYAATKSIRFENNKQFEEVFFIALRKETLCLSFSNIALSCFLL